MVHVADHLINTFAFCLENLLASTRFIAIRRTDCVFTSTDTFDLLALIDALHESSFVFLESFFSAFGVLNFLNSLLNSFSALFASCK